MLRDFMIIENRYWSDSYVSGIVFPEPSLQPFKDVYSFVVGIDDPEVMAWSVMKTPKGSGLSGGGRRNLKIEAAGSAECSELAGCLVIFGSAECSITTGLFSDDLTIKRKVNMVLVSQHRIWHCITEERVLPGLDDYRRDCQQLVVQADRGRRGIAHGATNLAIGPCALGPEWCEFCGNDIWMDLFVCEGCLSSYGWCCAITCHECQKPSCPGANCRCYRCSVLPW